MITMFERQAILDENQLEQIRATLGDLQARTQAHSLFLADPAGRPVTWLSQVTEVQAMTLSTLAAGSFAAANEMARLVKPDATFSSHYCESADCHICTLTVADGFLLIAAYDKPVRLGPVRLFARQAAESLATVVRRAAPAVTATDGNSRVDAGFGAALADELDLVFAELEGMDG
jgi:predicted regulator of Ras-like GTPase activity (Roadblock/LC7/MglB family)